MNYIEFKNAAGETYYVNLEKLTDVKVINDEVQTKSSNGVVLKAPLEIFKKAVQANPAKELSDMIPRLITALERLTVHIPSSIRLHM